MYINDRKHTYALLRPFIPTLMNISVFLFFLYFLFSLISLSIFNRHGFRCYERQCRC